MWRGQRLDVLSTQVCLGLTHDCGTIRCPKDLTLAVLFTRDDDLPGVARQRQEAGRRFSGVIYAHQRRISIGACYIHDLEMIAQVGEPDDFADSVQFLPL